MHESEITMISDSGLGHHILRMIQTNRKEIRERKQG